jgi:hypothetical protein
LPSSNCSTISATKSGPTTGYTSSNSSPTNCEQPLAALRRRAASGAPIPTDSHPRQYRQIHALLHRRQHTNLFQPSFKLKEKKRIGARVIKRYHPPVPPMDRVLTHAQVGEEA